MISQKTKAKIFPLYWGQKILILEEGETFPYKVGVILNRKGDYLKLRPISALTDEEAINVALLQSTILGRVGWEVKVTRNIKESIYVWGFYGADNIKIAINECSLNIAAIDYLRSIGIALPVNVLEDGKPRTYPVQELIDNGVFKVEGI